MTRKKIRFAGREFRLPGTKNMRIAFGVLLVVGGLLGFLPILGFWMIPLGLLVLSVDLPVVRRWRRNIEVRWEKWRRGNTTAERRENGLKAARVTRRPAD